MFPYTNYNILKEQTIDIRKNITRTKTDLKNKTNNTTVAWKFNLSCILGYVMFL